MTIHFSVSLRMVKFIAYTVTCVETKELVTNLLKDYIEAYLSLLLTSNLHYV